MSEIYDFCQNLSNTHIVKTWSKLGPTQVARELKSLGLARFPQHLRESVLKAYVCKLRKKYDALRKDGGVNLEQFLRAPFEFPVVEGESVPIPRGAVPKEVDGVGDENILRQQNISLNADLAKTQDELLAVRQHSAKIVYRGRVAKRKAEEYDDLKKKHKAAHEQAKYWQRQAQIGRKAESVQVAAELASAKKEIERLRSENEYLEQQQVDLQQRLEDALLDKSEIQRNRREQLESERREKQRKEQERINELQNITKGLQDVGGLWTSAAEVDDGLLRLATGSRGDKKKQHKLRYSVAPLMLKTNEVSPHAEPMDVVAQEFVDKMKRELDPRSKKIDLLDQKMFLWSMESISCVLLNKRFGCFNDPPPAEARLFIGNLMGFFAGIQSLLYSYPLYDTIDTPGFKKFSGYADNMIDTMSRSVDEHWAKFHDGDRSAENNESFITKLLDAGLDKKLAIETIVDLFTGSVETTSNTIGWILYLLSVNPEAQTKAQEEIDRVLGPVGGKIDRHVLGKLSYIKAVVRETFRLFPITYVTSRLISEDIEIGGYHVPKGTHCQASLYSMGRSEILFNDPLAFRPERWLRSEQELDAKIKAFSSLPFGHGARMCIGRRFAEQEIYIMLTRILQSFKVSYSIGAPPPRGTLKLVLVPEDKIPLEFEIR